MLCLARVPFTTESECLSHGKIYQGRGAVKGSADEWDDGIMSVKSLLDHR